jgi:hypothetical protein
MLSCLTVSLLVAQGLFHQAPPGVEDALRERVKKFYEADIAGKKEDAVKFVTASDRDGYRKADRRTAKSFEWNQVTWGEDFKTAKVVVNLALSGVDAPPFPLPEASNWRLEKGEWVWYLPPRK